MMMKKINKQIFEEVEITFPVEDELAIVIGTNGTGKTLMLEQLKEYWEEQGEEVLYFPDERLFSEKAHTSLWYLLNDDLLNKYGIQKDLMCPEEMEGSYIRSGYYQLLNFFGTIMTHFEQYQKDVVVIIDEPERNLHLGNRKDLLSDILNLPSVKKLVVATHCPETIQNHFNEVIEIEKILEYKT